MEAQRCEIQLHCVDGVEDVKITTVAFLHEASFCAPHNLPNEPIINN